MAKSTTQSPRSTPLHWSTDEAPAPFMIITKGEGFPTVAPSPCSDIGTHPPHIHGDAFCQGISVSGQLRVVIEQNWSSTEEAELKLNGDSAAAVVLLTPADPDNNAAYRRWVSADRVSGLNGRVSPSEQANGAE